MADGKVVMIALGTALLGFLAGSFTGRSSTRDLEARLEQTTAELEKAKKEAAASAPLAMGIRQLFRAPEPGETRTAPPSAGSPEAAKPGEDEASDEEDGSPRPKPLGATAPDSDERKQAIEQGAATWRIRAAQARASFLEAADLSKEQEANLQRVVDTMNQEVKQALQQAMEKVDFTKPERRDLVDLAVQMGQVYQDVDDDLRQVLTPEQMTTLNSSEFDIFSQVDPEVVMPLLMKIDRPEGDDGDAD